MASVELGLNQRATAVIERLAWWMAGQEKAVRDLNCWPLVRDLAESAPRLDVPASVPEQWRRAIYNSIMALAVNRIWSTTRRTVFPIHPVLVDELEDSTSGELPGPIFDRLPRPNPLVLFSQPLSVTTPDGHRGELLGFYVYGRRAETQGRFCSTDDPAHDALGIMAATSLVDEYGNEKDMDLTRLTVPIGRERFTIEDATENTLKAFGAEPGMVLMSGAMQDWVRTLTRAALHALLYLCSDEPDILTRPAKQQRAAGRGKDKASKPPQIFNVGWELGPALLEARRSSNDGSPATFRTIWAADAKVEPKLIFHHADQQLDDHLASTAAELTELRQALQDARRISETLRARAIDLETRIAAQQDTSESLRASRVRLIEAVLRYRAEAATIGSPQHLESLRRQLQRRDEELMTAHGTIDELATRLQEAHQELEQRPARYKWSPHLEPDSDDTTSASAEDDQHPGLLSWPQLCVAAADLPHLWCSPDLAELAAQLPARRDWLTTTWRALRALSAYAATKEATRAAGRSLTPVRNFAAYLQADINEPKISATQLATRESESVVNNPRLRSLRERPVPTDIDATGVALHLAHIRISQTAPYPRLHFLDATDKAGLICLGYLGPHLLTR